MRIMHLDKNSVKNSYSYKYYSRGVGWLIFISIIFAFVSLICWELSNSSKDGIREKMYAVIFLIATIFIIGGLIYYIIKMKRMTKHAEDYCPYNAKVESMTVLTKGYGRDRRSYLECEFVFEDETGEVIRKTHQFGIKCDGIQLSMDDTPELPIAYDSKRDRFIIIDAWLFE